MSEIEHEPFVPDATGVVQLGRKGRSDVAMIFLFIAVAAAMLISCWFQERRLSALLVFSAILCFAIVVFMSLHLRQWWLTRAGLAAESGNLVWTEVNAWTPRQFRLPLCDIECVRLIETDPMHHDLGIAIVLKVGSSCPSNLAPGLKKVPRDKLFPNWFELDDAVPLERLVIWDDET